MSKTNKKTKKIKTPSSKIALLVFGIVYVITMSILLVCSIGGSSESKYLNNINYVYDYENFFSSDEQTQINESCKEVASKSKIAIFVATTERSYSYAEMNGEDFCQKNNFSVYDTFIVLILNKYNVDGSNYHIDIYTFGKAENKVKENEINAILYSDDCNKVVGENQSLVVEGLDGCIKKCATAFKFLLPKSWATICILALVLSLIIAFIVKASIKKSYSRKRTNQTYSLKDNSKLNLTNQSDDYITTTITSVVIRDDNHNNSHSGGSHSSGGGGGMRHRGGR